MLGRFNVLMVGRYAGEKRQDVLIDACARSRYAQQLQVILAGKGPLERKYRRLAEKLPNPIVMEFYTRSGCWTSSPCVICMSIPPTLRSRP